MPVPISNVTRRAVYSPTGTGGEGPYAFTFEILANTDIAVFKDDTLLTLTTHYTVSIAANGTGSVTITATGLALSPTSPTQYAIVGNRTISRSTDFTTGGDFFANTLNDELDQQTIFAQQNAEGIVRSLQAPQTDPTTINMILPRSTVRASKVLAFDSSGNPTATEFIGSNRGNWATSTIYYVRDIVKDTSNSNIYNCLTQHTSTGSQPISSNADVAKWSLLVDAAAAATSAAAAATSATAAASSASGASTSATNASNSASTASTQASNASTSATSASGSASTATTQATAAGTSATSAAASATSATASAATATTQATTATTQATNASTSATNAATSATTATTQATTATTAATTATTQATAASTSATNAATSASNASTSATAAAASATAAAASFDAFDDIYLGAKASDPTVDNDGNALTTGDQYFNTTANELRVYNGSTWQAASTVGGTVTNLTVTNGATIQGLTVGKGGGAVSTNTALGNIALNSNTTGANSTAVGQGALSQQTTGGTNDAFGRYALGSATVTGTGNAGFGSGSLTLLTSGVNNVASGADALYNNSTGGYNTAVGQGSLRSNTTASNNTAVGYQAGYSNTTGTDNFFGGLQAGYASTTGGNVAVGSNAFKTSTTGGFNSAIGYQAMQLNTTGSNNTSLGYFSLYTNTTGLNNTVIGSLAGDAGTFNYSTIIGSRAGGAQTSGDQNTYVGEEAGGAMTTGSRNTLIGRFGGNSGGLDIRTASNNIVLSDGDGNPWVVINSGGSMVLGGNGYSYDASPYQATEGFIVGLNDATRYGAIFGCNNVANREAVVLVNPNGAVGSIRTNGSATTFNTSSDYRLKENIAPMTGALAKVAQLKPVTYKWKIDGTDGEGFIAHELAEVCPSAVSGEKDAVDKNGKIKPQGIDVSFLVATLTAAIQELKAEFDAYKATHP